jgi:S-adenosylmethionine:tRNA ribosyltransferase-isomerase
MHPKDISIQDFTYDLPEERIAKYPLEVRDQSKLLVWKAGQISESIYQHLHEQLPADSFLVCNNTKVVEARLLFQKATGGQIEIFCLEPDDRYSDITNAMLSRGEVYWRCLIGGAKKWKEGSLVLDVSYQGQTLTIHAKKVASLHDCFLIHFSWNQPKLSFAEVLHAAGSIPLPPYLNRATEASDAERYQTVYAQHDGSVAAPTAGLHFTERVLNNLATKNIHPAFVTLHVGAGTFKPVKAAKLEDHDMHAEWIDVEASLIQQLQQASGKIIAVGTTSLRTIETLYWMGVKVLHHTTQKTITTISLDDLVMHQWDAYELPQDISRTAALQALLDWMQIHQTTRLMCKTQILIAPSYRIRMADALITNFHQPQSTLLLLISAVVGDAWKNIYQHALANNYRFLSYGDGSLLWCKD